MPPIQSIPIILYTENMPYNYAVDNLPFQGLIAQIALVNDATDANTAILNGSVGTAGTLAARLAQSLNGNGTLNNTAMNNPQDSNGNAVFHSISAHVDDGGFVRMTSAERARLALISDGATVFVLKLNGGATATMVNLINSGSVTWTFDGTNLAAVVNFPTSVFHTHAYSVAPTLVTPPPPAAGTSNWTAPASYMQGSLRVYINGARIPPMSSSFAAIIPPSATVPPLFKNPVTYSEGAATGGIVMNRAFTTTTSGQDIIDPTQILIDFDRQV